MTKLVVRRLKFSHKFIEVYQKLKHLEFLEVWFNIWAIAMLSYFPSNNEILCDENENCIILLAEKSCLLSSFTILWDKRPINAFQQFLQDFYFYL